MFLLTLIVLMFISADLTFILYLQSVPTGNYFSFSKNLGLLQYCFLIIYVLKSLLFPCAYMVLCTFSVQKICHQTTSRSDLSSDPFSRTQDLCICINVKNNNEGGVFLFLFNGHCCGWRFEIDIIKSQCIKMPFVNDSV